MKRGPKPHPDILTPREWEVLELIREGLSNEDIAARLEISIDGVKYHVSEILGKLGVRDRLEAARWRPERQWRPWAIVSLPLSRWPRSLATRAVAFALAAGVAAMAGLLIWGLVTTRGGDDAQPSLVVEPPPTPTRTPPAVLIFDTASEQAMRLPGDHNITFAKWLTDGETFIALDIDARAWKAYDVDGGELRTLVTLPPEDIPYVTAHLYPSPRGDVAILTRDSPPDREPSVPFGTTLLELDSLAESSLPAPPGQNVSYLISPDGSRLAFSNEGEDNVSIMLAETASSDATVLRSVSRPDWSIVKEWSPDGSELLIQSNGVESSNTVYEVLDLSGTLVWRLLVPTRNSYPNVQWAGPGRVLIDQSQEPIVDASTPSSRRLLRVADGSELPVPESLAGATLTVSPDGRYAIARGPARNADEVGHRFDVRCSLVDFTTGRALATEENLPAGYCGTIDWTADSRFAIVTGGGN